MNRYSSKGRISRWLTVWAALVTSMYPMIEASDVSLTRMMNCVTSDGSMFRTACGRMTARIVVPYRSPVASAASTCPRGTDWMPARMISPRYAASNTTNATRATQYWGSDTPVAMGMKNQNQKTTITSGTPRMTWTYRDAGKWSHEWLDSRAMATPIPRRKPSTMVGTARAMVPPPNAPMPRSPWTRMKRQLSAMTPKSRLIAPAVPGQAGRASGRPPLRSMRRSPASDDEAGDRHAALDPSHRGGYQETEREVDQGASSDRLEPLRRVALDLARHEGCLGHADGQRERGVL